ncbi:MAG: valine--tRNA ligase [Candidatus Portnoybacteria bacterium CG10_big_fil_rev_8_21_14_0_10_36_7]|uniref:Valine--tRNA ligase n=1 Tax=Candidatus Portnoybacteria bacterium CG10_big_fil_rev_8_21_14_0_10_36_7 TaxID=1974812 RepID=A0A2M8KDJ6_9BACT|nr:MAG: valine--tRNA ligase [Candidatus Portnoybacteria bacterium CG10_big_fil_rev_8_21_14_0_10_36_7]
MSKPPADQYSPKNVEEKIYRLWEESGYFAPDKHKAIADNPNSKKTFCITIPPPNVTGNLHMGHALNCTIQDILIRQKRMQGYKTLWIPGTDHAGIATQNVVEKDLKKQNISRHDLGREKFLDKVWEWKKKYGDIILNQYKQLGASLDWSRTRFTMDNDYAKAVETAFLHYHKKGLIYQGERTINWCVRCATSLSDLELEYEEETGNLWFIKYPLKDSKEFITVATTRPETMLGDSGIAVNPKDTRYKDLIDKFVVLPLVNRDIPIVADRMIEMEFGTGLVKVTPAHDLTDFEIGQRNNLANYMVIGANGRMTELAGKYKDMKVQEARNAVVKDLTELGLIEKIEPNAHRVAKCYRCARTIEPILSKQWFVKMNKLAKIAANEVKKGNIKFHPRRFEKTYLSWLENIKDWCISRQIWWGHKIPIEGENDVLDTWFSAALWPFATLGWPEKTNDLKNYYPTQVLSTARDIINLWVSRMIFSGLEFTKQKPFSDVIIHATILAKDGRRMSKSLGTGVDPIILINKYGGDATRFGLIWQAMGGQDIKFDENAMMAGKKFCNKLWNAGKFVMIKIGDENISAEIPQDNLTEADKIIIEKTENIVSELNKQIADYNFGQALHSLYDFFWHDFCDVYLEASKKQESAETKQILLYILKIVLKLAHPFTPFITEEIYSNQLLETEPLIIAKWPK